MFQINHFDEQLTLPDNDKPQGSEPLLKKTSKVSISIFFQKQKKEKHKAIAVKHFFHDLNETDIV